MGKTEIVLAFVLALAAMAGGFLIYRHFFDMSTLKPKPRFLGLRQRLWEGARRQGKRIALIVSVVILGILVGYLAIRFAAPLARAIGRRLSPPAPEAAMPAPALPLPPSEPWPPKPAATIADHQVVDEVRLGRLSLAAIDQAKSRLHIFFVHGTHGSQITYGMKGLAAFKGPMYDGLDIKSLELPDRSEADLQGWAEMARSYLADPNNKDTNVVMWSWSDELGSAGEQTVADYLQLTGSLEAEYPAVRFVYMTGHLDGTGVDGNLSRRNAQIRAYCLEQGKILYDFADIESYDPDQNYYGDKSPNDGCWYDSDANGSLDRNWAKEWSEANPGKWYDCYAAHSFPLNANLKAYAAWWLWARLAEAESFDESL